MSENKEEILANFQSISGIDDVGEAFSHLEETNWDLMAAIQRVMPQDADMSPPPPPPPAFNAATMNNFTSGASTSSSHSRYGNNINVTASSSSAAANAAESAFVPVASTSADADIIDLTSDIGLDNTKPHNFKFNIQYNQKIYTVQLPSYATVDQLKNRVADATNVPKCRQALRGWPPEKLHESQYGSTKLNTLGLSAENELIMDDLTQDGFMDYENDEIAHRLKKTFALNIVEQPSGRQIQLNFPGHTTIQEVKSDLYDISDIQVRHQEWTGWPQGCDNNSTLAQSGIELSHNFTLQNAAEKSRQNSKSTASPRANTVALDTDSSDEFEDASDFNACEDFFTDTPQMQPPVRHLIANHTDNETIGSIDFVRNYTRRFGEPHPVFFTGSLEDALKEACNKPARDRKLLAIYLHHGESILTNVFCDHKMKHDSIMQTFAHNFILYGWDLTFESNKDLFLSSLTACVGTAASLTARNIPIDKLPSLMIIGKSRLSGRSSCEVLSVIHGDVGLDDLLSRLLESVELYSEHLQGEIRDEDERAARDQVKAEQDMAYQETLQADMAKEAAKRQKEAAVAAERKRIESEKAEEDARREGIRLTAEQSLSKEPNENAENITKIRVRKPTGNFLERRFYVKDKLQDLLNFVASNGFLIEEYKVISSWPRRDLTSVDATQTLESLKLYPQEVVILEER